MAYWIRSNWFWVGSAVSMSGPTKFRPCTYTTAENLSGEAIDSELADFDQDSWLYETCTLSLELIVDLFVKFYSTVHPLQKKVLMLLVGFINRPHQSLAGIGIAASVWLISNSGDLFSDEKWIDVVFSLKEAAASTLPEFSFIFNEETSASSNEETISREGTSEPTETDPDPDTEGLRTRQIYATISDVKSRCAVQLLLIQVEVQM
ncbi:brefeldin A-inhibited guanine nucleotide-exchange protein 2-like [Silene latifolia]|uniref:brefeldin A-inhibited guanine nucleotide-exchange protein 2-like n=1 Tax=Silene latifolia TaxID=37657 RepID=UPI003D76EA5A